MARLPALIHAYAGLDGRDPGTIRNIARTIREAEFIPTTKRGNGASAMSVREAANLILGANGAEIAAEAPKAVRRLRALVRESVTVPGKSVHPDKDAKTYEEVDRRREINAGARFQLEQSMWGPLVAINRFGDAVEWLIGNAVSIRAEMVKFELEFMVSEPRIGLLGKEARSEIERGGPIPSWVVEIANDQIDNIGFNFKLTISDEEASFEAQFRHVSPFTPVRIVYSVEGDDEARRVIDRRRHRRKFVEIDFNMIVGLALVVAPKPEANRP